MKFPELSAAELRDSGLLLEANRRFFHPLGLALTVDLPDEGEDYEPRVFIQDDRGDPEGWYFGSLDDDDAVAKITNVRDMAAARLPYRVAALGYWEQPLPAAIKEA